MVKHLRQIPLDTYKPLREVVIENIRDAILSGDFPAGMRLTNCSLLTKWVSAGPRSGKPSATWNRKALWL
jgi:hypothetical protein